MDKGSIDVREAGAGLELGRDVDERPLVGTPVAVRPSDVTT